MATRSRRTGSRPPTARADAAALRRAPARGDGRTVRAAAPAAGGDDVQRLSDRAYEHLEELIVTLQLPPGSVVSETGLSRLLAIGRTPIREALHRLARERLLQILPRRGVIVSDINVKSQLRLLELRREVERLVARSAARRADDAERRRFVALAVAFERAGRTNDDLAFIRTDREFNELCVEAARNEFASSTMNLMQPLSRRFWYLHYKQAADLPESARLHADVARAIAAGDEAAAATATDALLDKIEDFTRSTVSTDF